MAPKHHAIFASASATLGGEVVRRHDRNDEWKGSDRWDWSTVVFILMAIFAAVFFTMALWTPHPFSH